jgi:hypothetical protein
MQLLLRIQSDQNAIQISDGIETRVCLANGQARLDRPGHLVRHGDGKREIDVPYHTRQLTRHQFPPTLILQFKDDGLIVDRPHRAFNEQDSTGDGRFGRGTINGRALERRIRRIDLTQPHRQERQVHGGQRFDAPRRIPGADFQPPQLRGADLETDFHGKVHTRRRHIVNRRQFAPDETCDFTVERHLHHIRLAWKNKQTELKRRSQQGHWPGRFDLEEGGRRRRDGRGRVRGGGDARARGRQGG